MESNEVKKPRKKRATSPRNKKPGSNPATSERLKKMWADPEQRADMMEKIRAAVAKRDPAKNYRRGVPDGMRKPEADRLWALAREKATQVMSELERQGIVEVNPAPDSEAGMAKAALHEAMVILKSPITTIGHKLTAARTVLEWTKAKPATKGEVTIKSAEAWLDEVHTQAIGAGAASKLIEDFGLSQT